MNLQISYNWLREYLPGLKATPEEVAEKLSLHAFSVERVRPMIEGLDTGIVVGRIEKIEDHPKADKLRIAYTEAWPPSRRRPGLPPLKIVCGGTNIREGQLVAVALPGAKVCWHGEGELVELQATEIRGVKSEGMICAVDEIGLDTLTLPSPIKGEGKSEREILDLSFTGARVGEPVARALGFDDTVLEVEVTSNRPDAMGVVGLAREVGAIFNTELRIKNKELSRNIVRNFISRKGGTQGAALPVRVGVPKLCSRYIAVVMEGIKVAPSPWWMQRRLMASGVRAINNIVDITNYVLLEWGQPCHAFDLEKLHNTDIHGQKTDKTREEIVVRVAKQGEKILALDGNTYELDGNILVVADAKKPVAIAGIMGGEETGVHEGTSRIVYEIANFDPVAVRRGEHQLGLTSASSARFNKGLPVQLPAVAAARLIELTKKVAGGEAVQFIDRVARGFMPRKDGTQGAALLVTVDLQEVTQKIGVNIPPAQIKKYLTRLGFGVTEARLPSRRKPSFPVWHITFPYWRTLEADGTSDIAEEVARMHGYHKISGALPQGDLPAELPNAQFIHERVIKEALHGAEFTELYTYSLMSREDVARAGFDPDRDALALANPLSQEMTHLRPWLGISALKAVAENEKDREQLRLFELSAEYHPRTIAPPLTPPQRGGEKRFSPLPEVRPGGVGVAQLPEERQKLIVVSAGREEREGENFYAVKGAAEHLAEILALPNFGYEKVGSINAPWVKHYHPARVLLCKGGRDILGVVGELHPQLLRVFGIEERAAFLEWEMKSVYPLIGRSRFYEPPLPYPPVKRDIAFVVSKDVEYVKLHMAIDGIDPLVHSVKLFDQYEGKGVPEGARSLAFHLSYASPERTLKAEEAEKVHRKLGKMLEDKFGAKIRD